MYILSASTISHQNTFRNPGFSIDLPNLELESQLQEPSYKEFIPAMARRRMTPIMMMSAACSINSLKQAEIEQPDAIIVGTGIGGSVHTEKFLNNIVDAGEGLISPTSFALSTHNTVAGQISLMLKNHGYNMTHVQNSLSFEYALLDAMLCLSEKDHTILVGAADEAEGEGPLYNLQERLKNEDLYSTSGASFFVVSDEKPKGDSVKIVDVETIGLVENLSKSIMAFFKENQFSEDSLDLVLYAYSTASTKEKLQEIFPEEVLFDYQQKSGSYFTNSAFALQYAMDWLTVDENKGKRVLICNNLIPENLGLILLAS